MTIVNSIRFQPFASERLIFLNIVVSILYGVEGLVRLLYFDPIAGQPTDI